MTPFEEMVDNLGNKILKVVGEANGFNGFDINQWTKKYGKQVTWQVVNKLCLTFLRQVAREAYEDCEKIAFDDSFEPNKTAQRIYRIIRKRKEEII